MVWIPDPNEPEAKFDEPIILNTLAIVERDFKEALDYYSTLYSWGVLYPDFAERALGQVLRNEFPCFAIGPRTNTTAGAEDNACIIEVVRYSNYIGVAGDSAADVTTKIMRYTKVFNSVLRSARNELRQGLSNGFGLIIENITHDYGPVADRESIYFRAVLIEVALSLRER